MSKEIFGWLTSENPVRSALCPVAMSSLAQSSAYGLVLFSSMSDVKRCCQGIISRLRIKQTILLTLQVAINKRKNDYNSVSEAQQSRVVGRQSRVLDSIRHSSKS